MAREQRQNVILDIRGDEDTPPDKHPSLLRSSTASNNHNNNNPNQQQAAAHATREENVDDDDEKYDVDDTDDNDSDDSGAIVILFHCPHNSLLHEIGKHHVATLKTVARRVENSNMWQILTAVPI